MAGAPSDRTSPRSTSGHGLAEPILADAEGRLRAAARRSRVAMLVRGAAGSLTVAVVVLALLEVLRGLLPHTWLGWQASVAGEAAAGSIWWNAVAAGLVLTAGLVVSVVVAIRRTPTLSEMAKAIDLTFSLDERLSTAVEVEARARDGRGSSIERALLHDAADHAKEIDLRRLVPLRLPRFVWTVPALAALVALLQVAPPAPLAIDNAPSQQAIASNETLSAEEKAATAEDLRRIASQINDAAKKTNDPMTRAVGRTLTNVAEALDVSDTVDRQKLVEQLKELLAQTEQGMSGGGDAVASVADTAAPEDLLKSALARLQSTPQERGGEVVALAERPTTVGDGAPKKVVNDNRSPIASSDNVEANHPGDTPEAGRLKSFSGAQTRPDEPSAPHGPYPVGVSRDYGGEDPFTIPSGSRPQSATDRGQLAGPANNSRRGESVLGGLGTQNLNGESDWADLEIALGDKLVVSDNEPLGAGRRIRLEAPPQTQLTETAGERASSSGNWQRAPEGEVVRTSVSIGRREIVRRYFLPKPEAASP